MLKFKDVNGGATVKSAKITSGRMYYNSHDGLQSVCLFSSLANSNKLQPLDLATESLSSLYSLLLVDKPPNLI